MKWKNVIKGQKEGDVRIAEWSIASDGREVYVKCRANGANRAVCAIDGDGIRFFPGAVHPGGSPYPVDDGGRIKVWA